MRVDLSRTLAAALSATGISDLEYDADDLEEMRPLIRDVAARGPADVKWKLVPLDNIPIGEAGNSLLKARCRRPSLMEYLAFAEENSEAGLEEAVFSVGTMIIGDSHKGSVKIPCFTRVDLTSVGSGVHRCMRWVLYDKLKTRVSITVLGIVLPRT